MQDINNRFLDSILPNDGIYVVVWKEENRMRQKPLASIADVAAWCALHSGYLIDSWFALASYSQGWHEVVGADGVPKNKLRTQDNAKLCKALWLDIDVGEGKDYSTREEAADALLGMCRALSLPRPWVLASSHTGLHVYWSLQAAVDVQTWRRLAAGLDAACKRHNVKADPARTRDPASILRAPGTWNCKSMDNPAQVTVLIEGVSSPVDTFANAFAGFKVEIPVPHKALVFPPTFPMVTMEGVMERYFHMETPPKADPFEVMHNCRQMNPKFMDAEWKEPHFRSFCSVMRHCENGVFLAYYIARQSKHYRSDSYTDAKMQPLIDNDIPPHRCDEFAKHNPKGCEGCPFKGMVNSPIGTPRLARKQEVVVQPEVTPQPEAVASEESKDEAQPEPYTYESRNYRVNHAGCFAKVENDEGVYWRNIYEYPVYPIQKVKDRNNAGELQVSYVFRKHGIRGHDDVQIGGDVLLGTGLGSYLGGVGFLLQDKDRKYMTGLLIDMLKNTEERIPETRISNRLGWDDSFKSFLLGNKVYRTDGEVVDVTPRGAAKDVSDLTDPRGTLEEWKEIANVYNRKGLEWVHAVVATAFASPLMPLGALESAALMFVTGEMGTGKSTAISLAVSVYGHPKRLMINKDDTYLARLSKLGTMHNIAAGFDEMTNLSPKEASEMAYQITQGRGKDRMLSSGEGLQMNTTQWSCLPVMSANDSIVNALSMHRADASAQMSRVLEVVSSNVNEVFTAQEMLNNNDIVRRLPMQYGTAGDAFMRYVTANMDTVNRMIADTEREFITLSGLDNSYRFWTYMCTRMIVGLRIAVQLGLVGYSVDNFITYLLDCVKENKARMGRFVLSPDRALELYLTQSVVHRLVVVSARRPRGAKDDLTVPGVINDVGYVVSTPASGRDVHVRVELQQGLVYISTVALKAWCERTGVVFTDMYAAMKARYGETLRPVNKELGASTAYRGTGAVACYELPAPPELIESARESLSNHPSFKEQQ